MSMRTVNAQVIHEKVRDMIVEACRVLDDSVLAAIQKSMECETSKVAREILRQLLKNAELARHSELALCQDTGVAVFFVEHGESVRIEGGSLGAVLTEAVVEAYDKGFLRKSICHPLSRKNSGDNTPAVIHTEFVPGDTIRIRFMPKGGGSENMSQIAMLKPSQGWAGIKEFVLRTVAEAGANPCPPTVVGVGIGGTFDLVPNLAKKALFRPLGIPHSDREIDKMENELLAAINNLGIGPMGLGGKTTALGVRIALYPCHIASLPVAVNIQCHSHRSREIVV